MFLMSKSNSIFFPALSRHARVPIPHFVNDLFSSFSHCSSGSKIEFASRSDKWTLFEPSVETVKKL